MGRTPRGRLPWLVLLPFVTVFVVLAFALRARPGDTTLAFVYFVALTAANLYIISVFWSAMADVWRPELAKRFFGYVAAGGSAGALLGPFIVRSLVHELGATTLILVACGFIALTAALVSRARATLRRVSPLTFLSRVPDEEPGSLSPAPETGQGRAGRALGVRRRTGQGRRPVAPTSR